MGKSNSNGSFAPKANANLDDVSDDKQPETCTGGGEHPGSATCLKLEKQEGQEQVRLKTPPGYGDDFPNIEGVHTIGPRG